MTTTEQRPPTTARQQQCLDIVVANLQVCGPTVREVARQMGVSTTAAVGHIKALERKGYLRCHAGKTRGIEVVQ